MEASTNTVPPSPSEKSESDSPLTKSESNITTVTHNSVDIGHIYTRQEFERQVHGRMEVAGAEYSQTKMIKVDDVLYKKMLNRQKLCYSKISNPKEGVGF